MQKINTSHTTALNDKKEEQENKPITLTVRCKLPNGKLVCRLVTIKHPTDSQIHQRRRNKENANNFNPSNTNNLSYKF